MIYLETNDDVARYVEDHLLDPNCDNWTDDIYVTSTGGQYKYLDEILFLKRKVSERLRLFPKDYVPESEYIYVGVKGFIKFSPNVIARYFELGLVDRIVMEGDEDEYCAVLFKGCSENDCKALQSAEIELQKDASISIAVELYSKDGYSYLDSQGEFRKRPIGIIRDPYLFNSYKECILYLNSDNMNKKHPHFYEHNKYNLRFFGIGIPRA